MSKLEELRAKLKAEQEKSNYNKDGTNSASGTTPLYSHWNIKDEEGNYSAIRFLPDGNADSSFFWVEKNTINIPFAGIKGKSVAPIKVTVPCMHMYGEKCPIIEATKPLWNTDPETARLYYKKRAYLFHGFVRRDGVGETSKPENPIRRFTMNTDLYKLISAGVMDPEMENLPTDYENGTDFNIYKTTKGKFAEWTTSRWARKSGALTEVEAAAIEQYGLPDLTSYLPKKPGPEELAIIEEMFLDSMNGSPYDESKYGRYYRPYGVQDDVSAVQKGSGNFTTTQSADDAEIDTTPKPVVQKTAEAVVAGSGNANRKASVADLLASIKKNQA